MMVSCESQTPSKIERKLYNTVPKKRKLLDSTFTKDSLINYKEVFFKVPFQDYIKVKMKTDSTYGTIEVDSNFIIIDQVSENDMLNLIKKDKYANDIIMNIKYDNNINTDFKLFNFLYNIKLTEKENQLYKDNEHKKLLKLKNTFLPNGSREGIYKFRSNFNFNGFQYGEIKNDDDRTMIHLFPPLSKTTFYFTIITRSLSQAEVDYIIRTMKVLDKDIPEDKIERYYP